MVPSAKSEVVLDLPPSWLEPGAPPLEIDIGCHKGLFLVGMATLYPDRNFLGVERQTERVNRTGKKIESLQLPNARVLCAGGLESLHAFPDASVTCIHVLFPDPWPKRRHHHNRLVQANFLEAAHRVLKFSGLLRLITDDADYAQSMQVAAQNFPAFQPATDDARGYPLTEFQKKFLTDGRPVHSLFLTKPAIN